MYKRQELHGALLRQIGFSLAVLAIEIPLGILLALSMPASGWRASAVLVIIALSLLIPWNVVGTIWQVFGRTDIGLLGATLSWLGADYNYTGNDIDAWVTVLVMDVWHWTPLVALLCYACLLYTSRCAITTNISMGRAIPPAWPGTRFRCWRASSRWPIPTTRWATPGRTIRRARTPRSCASCTAKPVRNAIQICCAPSRR